MPYVNYYVLFLIGTFKCSRPPLLLSTHDRFTAPTDHSMSKRDIETARALRLKCEQLCFLTNQALREVNIELRRRPVADAATQTDSTLQDATFPPRPTHPSPARSVPRKHWKDFVASSPLTTPLPLLDQLAALDSIAGEGAQPPGTGKQGHVPKNSWQTNSAPALSCVYAFIVRTDFPV